MTRILHIRATRDRIALRMGSTSWIVLLLCMLAAGRTAAGASGQTLQRFEYSLPRMGTLFRIVIFAQDSTRATSSAMAAFERVEQLEQIMSDYREDSELNFVCRNACLEPQRVSTELFYVLERAQHLSELSGGAFDITIGSVVWLWRAARRDKHLPSPEAIAAAEKAVGYRSIVLDPSSQTVFLKRRDMRLDLGAIGKGYAADEALAVIRSRGLSRAMVAGGGDIALGDPPPGKDGWQIAVQEPSLQGTKITKALSLRNVGISTSGDANQYLEEGGKRYSHIINPRDGEALQDSAGATVIASNGITADAMATTLCVMPPTDGIRLAESMRGVSAQIFRRGAGEIKRYSTPDFPKTIDAEPVSKAKSHLSGQDMSPRSSGKGGRAAIQVPPQD